MTESSDAGASMASKIGNLRLASDIDINDHIDLSGKPCRVIDLYTKRGLCHLHTINILTGYFVRRIVPISTEFVIPDVSRDLYQLTGISYKDDSVTLLHHSGAYTRDDIFLPENENLRTMMVDGFNDDKRVIVGIVTSLGQDAVYAVDVYQTGSANDIDFVAKNVGF
ncbi:eukaryotic translation initiation factor 5A-1-like isoform X2 [Brassica napus]|uniref:eukaryotic translation initiation factor 5A-1-like isoform X2 n=1 Tax=Brassica napus TaxID=3708 RepID=UPI0020792ACA|nr:eukaryotic translation initiation factor 5A-1-like isoform X2 [Brassica napus]